MTTPHQRVPDTHPGAAAADAAWPDLERRLHAAGDAALVLPVDRARGREVAAHLPADTPPLLLALAARTGGLLVDHGWFRLYAGGAEGLPDLAAANAAAAGHLLIGHDALGGRFAVDLGGLGVAPGEVCWFGPDTLRWEALGGGLRAFLHALLDGALAEIFAGLRWDGWEHDVEALAPDHALDVTPPLFTRAAHEPGATVVRRPVPADLLAARFDALGAELDAPDPDSPEPGAPPPAGE